MADLAPFVYCSRGVSSIQRIEVLRHPSVKVAMDTRLPRVRAAMTRGDAGFRL